MRTTIITAAIAALTLSLNASAERKAADLMIQMDREFTDQVWTAYQKEGQYAGFEYLKDQPEAISDTTTHVSSDTTTHAPEAAKEIAFSDTFHYEPRLEPEPTTTVTFHARESWMQKSFQNDTTDALAECRASMQKWQNGHKKPVGAKKISRAEKIAQRNALRGKTIKPTETAVGTIQ